MVVTFRLEGLAGDTAKLIEPRNASPNSNTIRDGAPLTLDFFPQRISVKSHWDEHSIGALYRIFEPAIEFTSCIMFHWWQTGTVYQVYLRSFQDSNVDGIGDLEGIRQRLDYLVWLGVDAIWISPIYPSPMHDFGYDVADYCEIDPIFGSLESFDRLVDEAHASSSKSSSTLFQTILRSHILGS